MEHECLGRCLRCGFSLLIKSFELNLCAIGMIQQLNPSRQVKRTPIVSDCTWRRLLKEESSGGPGRS